MFLDTMAIALVVSVFQRLKRNDQLFISNNVDPKVLTTWQKSEVRSDHVGKILKGQQLNVLVTGVGLYGSNLLSIFASYL